MNGPLFAHTRVAAEHLLGHIAAHVEAAIRDHQRDDATEFTERLLELRRVNPIGFNRVRSILNCCITAVRIAELGEPESDLEFVRRRR